jgi:predicted nucleic acid-binding protein
VTHIYLDSSALVKQYIAEKGTGWIQKLLAVSARNTLYTVSVSPVEIVAAFFLRVRTSSISNAQAQQATSRLKLDAQTKYNLIEISPSLVTSAINLAEYQHLKGYDAIQLAAALALHQTRFSLSLSPIMFVSADKRLNEAAKTVGMVDIKNPNDY